MPYETPKFSVRTSLNFFVNVRFFSIFGTKRKHTSPTSSESVKDFVRTSGLEEKLDLWWKLQFPVQDAKTLSLNAFVNVCFFSVFGPKCKHTSPNSSESA